MADPIPAKPRRLWRIVFGLSLALNVAVVGVVLGAGLRDRSGGPGPRGFEMSLGPIGQALSKEDRRAIGRALRRDPQLRDFDRAAVRATIGEFAAVLREEPFSEEALKTVLDQARGRMDQVQIVAREALVDRISGMTKSERDALADRIEDAQARRRR